MYLLAIFPDEQIIGEIWKWFREQTSYLSHLMQAQPIIYCLIQQTVSFMHLINLH